MTPDESSTQIDVRDHLLVLVRRKWVVFVAVGACFLLSLVFSYLQTPKYTATCSLLIQRPSSASLFDPSGAQRINADLVAEIELQFFNSDAVKQEAQKKLGYNASATASAGGRGSTMAITVVDASAQRAADIGNAYCDAYVDVRRRSTIDDFAATAQATQQKIDEIDQALARIDATATSTPPETEPPTTTRNSPSTVIPAATTTVISATDKAQRDTLSAQKQSLQKSLDQILISQQNAQSGGPQLLSPAKPPSGPTSPNPKRDVLTGLLVGVLLGVAGAFLLDFLDDSIKSRTDLEAATKQAPILAIIPYLADWKNRAEAHLASIEQPSSPTAEAYRTLRTSVQFAGLERPIHRLQVTSPLSQDGKTTTCTNVAVALSRAGLRVVLIDCDLRRPRVHDFFNLSNTVGFTSVLLGECSLEDAVQSVPGLDTLKVLASGPTPPNPSELLAGRRAADLITALKDACDIVVIDTPPVLPVSDALVVSDLMDAVVLVAAAGSTTKKEAHRAFELLSQVDAPVIGTVLNSGPGQSGYGYGYGNNYSYGDQPTARPSVVGRVFSSTGRRRHDDTYVDESHSSLRS
jgi:capsular exopolysaccharide synthesis family protein